MALVILVYAAVAVFVAGNVYRVVRILRLPAHLRWELYPIPRGPRVRRQYGGSYFQESDWWTKPVTTSRASELALILSEVVCLKTLWERQRSLWLWSWLFHLGLYCVVVTAGLSVVAAANNGPQFLLVLIRYAAWGSACAGSVGALGLFAVRVANPRLRPYSSRADIFNLLLTAAIFLTAGAGLVWNPAMTEQMVCFVGGLLGVIPLPQLAGTAAAHIALLAAFLTYFPFTHMTHAYMKFFTFHAVRWDDTPVVHDPAMARAVARSFRRPISWSAPHIGGDGRQTWSSVLAREPEVKR
jgi:nitrate reductase gamma subunit